MFFFTFVHSISIYETFLYYRVNASVFAQQLLSDLNEKPSHAERLKLCLGWTPDFQRRPDSAEFGGNCRGTQMKNCRCLKCKNMDKHTNTHTYGSACYHIVSS